MCRPALLFLISLAVAAAVNGIAQSSPSTNDQPSAEELTQQLNNPVADLWLIVNQMNTSDVEKVPGGKHVNNYILQPILPVHLSKSWNLINRPYMPYFFNSPTLGDKPLTFPIQLINDAGLGDVGVVSLFSPAQPPRMGRGQFLWGAGPTFLFPTASKATFGFGKWMAGPSGVVAYLDKKVAFGLFVQQWWSYAGNSMRKDKNFAWFQYFAAYQFAPGWQITAGTPIISMDWKNKNVIVPVGAGVSYTAFFGPLPVELGIEYQKTVVHPENAPYSDNLIRMNFCPVLPALFGGKPRK